MPAFPVVCNLQKLLEKGCFSFCQATFLLSTEIIKTGSSCVWVTKKARRETGCPDLGCVEAGGGCTSLACSFAGVKL